MSRYIDADRLIETLNKEKVPFNGDVNYYILNAQAADVAEVRHGRWELYDICSVCGAQAEQQTNYCPNCGAKMEVEHDGDC